MNDVQGEQQDNHPRSSAEERKATIRAYAEHGMGVPPELEAQKPKKSSDKNSEGKHNPKEKVFMSNESPQPEAAPSVNPNPAPAPAAPAPAPAPAPVASADPTSGPVINVTVQSGEKKLSGRALDAIVEGSIFSVFAILAGVAVTFFSKKITG